MKRDRASLLAIPALLVGLLLFGRGHAPAPATAPASADSPRAPLPTEDLKLPPLDAFFRTSADQSAESVALSGASWEFHSIVVLVPSPATGHHDYIYDRAISSLQRAAEAAGFLYDRASLPWMTPPDSKETGEEKAKRPGYGVMLFRGAGEENRRKLLVALIVTETATAGVDKPAMVAALRIAAADPDARTEKKGIRVLGPAFSGSVDSLKLAICAFRQEAGPDVLIRMISGSATALSRKELEIVPGVTYSSTVTSDEVALKVVLDALTNAPFLARDREIAIVRESGTKYGTEVGGQDARGVRILDIAVPLHLAPVRETMSSGRDSSGRATLATGLETTSLVPLSLVSPPTDKEQTRSISALDPASTELSLASLLEVLESESYRFIGIALSDVRDAIFLAREIRQHCPNTVLFTLNPDILFLHSSVNDAFRGSLTVSPYLLNSQAELWTYPFAGETARHFFPDHYSEGIYNAAVALLDHDEQMVEYAAPFARRGERTSQPPVWLSVVGKNGFWPLRAVRLRECSGATGKGDLLADCAAYPRDYREAAHIESDPWNDLHPRVLVGAVVVFCLIILMLCSTMHGRMARERWALVAGPAYPREADRPRGDDRMGHLFALSLILVDIALFGLACLVMMFRVELDLIPRTIPWYDVAGAGLATLVACLTVLVAGITAVECFRSGPRGNRRILWRVMPRIPVVWFSLAILVTALLTCWQWAVKDDSQTALFRLARISHMGSGLSPFGPILCVSLSGLLYGVYSLKRLRGVEGMRGLRVLRIKQGVLAAARWHEDRIRLLMRTRPTSLPWWWVVACVVLLGLIWTSVYGLTNFESSWYGRFVLLAYSTLYLSVLLNGLRIVLVWIATRALLGRMSGMRIAAAFGAGTEAERARRLENLNGARRSLACLSDSIEAGRRLAFDGLACAAHDVAPAAVPWYADPPRLASVKVLLGRAGSSVRRALSARDPLRWKKTLRARRRAHKALRFVTTHVAAGVDTLELRAASAPPCEACAKALAAGDAYLVSRVTDLLQEVFSALRAQVAQVTIGQLLMLVAAGCYPFPERARLLMINWIVVGTMVGAFALVMIQINRNPILSALNGTTPDKVSWNQEFVVRMFLHGAVPLLALLGAQFPASFGSVMPWLGKVFGFSP